MQLYFEVGEHAGSGSDSGSAHQLTPFSEISCVNTMFKLECAEMKELSLPDMVAAHRLMQLSGREEHGRSISNLLLKKMIKFVANNTLDDENNVDSSLKRRVEEIDCEIPFTVTTKRRRYRSLDSIYKATRPVGDVYKEGKSLITGV